MSQRVDWAEGETAPRDFPLTDNEEPFDLTGASSITLLLTIRDSDTAVTSPGTVAVQGAAELGIVRVTPGAGKLLAKHSPYRARIKLTKGGQDYFFPNDLRGDEWVVGKP